MSELLTDELRSKLCHTICYSGEFQEDYNKDASSCINCDPMKALEEIIQSAQKELMERIDRMLSGEIVSKYLEIRNDDWQNLKQEYGL